MGKKDTLIIPAILEKTFFGLCSRIHIAETFSSWAQIDIADGKFVKNKTFLKLTRLEEVETSLSLEIHLMMENPEKYFPVLVKNKKIKRVIAHYESFKNDTDIMNAVNFFHRQKKEFGIAINPRTKEQKIFSLLKYIDRVICLTVDPGKQGNIFQKKVLRKISLLRAKEKNVILAVDGGINENTLLLCKKAGASVFYVGSYLFSHPDSGARYNHLKALIS